jgi:predicted RNA-binding Zn ribbon-like protein
MGTAGSAPASERRANAVAEEVVRSTLRGAVAGAREHVDDLLILRIVAEAIAEGETVIGEDSLMEILASVRR